MLKNAKTGQTLAEADTGLSPDKPFTREVRVGSDVSVYDLHLAVYDAGGRRLIELQRKPPNKVELPQGQKDPGDPKQMGQDELYHAGEWLDKFVRRNQGLDYFRQALAKDPKASRVNTEMGFLALKQGRWQEALKCFDTALGRDYDNARVHFGRGLACAGLSDYKGAASSWPFQ